MLVRLLGPIEVLVDGAYRPIPGVRRSAVLAALALEPGRVVSTERLMDVVWSGRPPETATNTLQRHVSGLRDLLGSRSAVLGQGSGYLLNVGEEATDLQLARRLVDGGPADLRRALALWRGPALSGLRGLDWFAVEADRVDELRQRIELALVRTRLDGGAPEPLVRELESLARERPHDEEAHRLLMLALYRCGRQAAALAVARRLRQWLSEEFGAEPGAAVADLEAAILRQDPDLAPAPPPVAHQTPPVADWLPVPAQLPRTIPVFAGRAEQLAELDDFLAGGQPIAAICGTAGVGKTTLAVHWAHLVAARFPDGQLHVNLRGYGPGADPLPADAAVVGFLEALGVRPDARPATAEARAGLYRSLLAGRRMLIVLDNALDADHVRPLLPGSANCPVVVTSRRELTPLVAIESARLVRMDLLTGPEARELLLRRVGERRLADEPAAVEEILERCAGLPLAVSVAAARIAGQPNRPLHALADELGQAALDTFDGGDPMADVRAVLSWSYHQLSPPAADLFRVLSVHPGPDFALPAAASIAGLRVPAIHPVLTELTRSHLLTARASRYGHHALMREYAHELLHAGGATREAEARAVEHYLRTAVACDRVMMPQRDPIALPPDPPGVVPEQPDDDQSAMDWFAVEREAILALAERALAIGLYQQTWWLAWAMGTFLVRRGRWQDLAALQDLALRAHDHLDDPDGQARSRGLAARARMQLHQYDLAYEHLRAALELTTDPVLHGYVRLDLAQVLGLLERHDEALEHARRAADGFAAIGHAIGRARALNSVGWYKIHCGQYDQAVADCTEAIALLRDAPDPAAEALTLDTMGLALCRLGRLEEAGSWYRRAVAMHHEAGALHLEAGALTHLGDLEAQAGRPGQARFAWQRAVEILEPLGDPDLDAVRERLRESDRLGS